MGCFYLHERPGKKGEAAADKLAEGGKAQLCGNKAFAPVMPVRAYDGRNGILVNQGLAGEDVPVSGTVLITLYNGGLDRQGNLGIRDDRRKHECVGMAAGLTEDPGDPEQKDGISLSNLAGIPSIPDKTAEMAAGTGKRG